MRRCLSKAINNQIGVESVTGEAGYASRSVLTMRNGGMAERS